LFNCGEGGIARAEAELHRAERQQLTVRNQILLDVHQAHQRYTQALAELDRLQKTVLPEIEAAIRRAERAYKEGDTAYTIVLETTRQFLDARLRREQLQADLRRAWADLERSVGQHLDVSPPPPVDQPLPPRPAVLPPLESKPKRNQP
jgi:cobalt-zinc-cadmium efflux system outer membrane protein